MPRTKEAFNAMRDQTRQKIEAAALSLFARKGLSVTINEIARTANLSQGLLYSHYPSKDSLIAELVRQAAESSGQVMESLAQSDDLAVVKIQQTTNIMLQMLSGNNIGIDYFMFMMQVGMSGFQIPETAWNTSASRNPTMSLAHIIAQGQSEGSVVNGDPIQLASIYWATIQGMCCCAITGMPLSPTPEMLSRLLLKEEFL